MKNNSTNNNSPDPEEIVQLMGTEATFGVKGNCGMCKKTIETAANSLNGVIKVNWNKNTKMVDLVYDSQTIDLITIHEAIAKSGYDTELVEHIPESYENLPLCCKYDPEMVITSN
ncbi:MAG: heavy-metal-associated domain-containing protein [Flavobacteriaceae bacterium]|tara:strand:+ start:184 stop:528 length:345 start_codon:yes stop_codon:yes gene_type:complete